MLAICPNTSEIWIFTGCHDPDSSKWVKQWVLTEHDLTVSGLDWSPVTHKIVSCSHDRNAFVWTYNEAENNWKPELVILRINRAATDVKWSYDGQKFAVASGAKCVPVCHYEESNDWWISKMIKKHKSTVLTVAWHPSNHLLATGCSDFKCRIFSAFVGGLDADVENGLFPRAAFGEPLFESDATHGWVEALAWSPSGTCLCYAGHDSSLTFITFTHVGAPPVSQTIMLENLPMRTLTFLADDTLVAAGCDFKPALFTLAGSDWAFNQWLDKKKEKAAPVKRESGFGAARAMFENKSSKGQSSSASSADKSLWTKHENIISDMHHLGGGVLSTTATDGRLVMWHMAECVQ
jgi:actin related protein 2/3 complex subunit 1A/1B